MRFATLNVWGHPDLIGRHGRNRMQAIVEALPALGCDVIAFQEVWRLEWREMLLEGSRRAGFPYHWTNEKTLGGSGLLTVSRTPLRDAHFHPYRLRGLPQRPYHGDYYSGKGVSLVTVDSPAGPVTVLNTHLHAQYAPDYADDYKGIRMAQVVEVAVALSGRSDPVVALGDFNLSEGKPEYEVLTGLSGLRDVAAELDRRQSTVLAGHPYRGGRPDEDRIDFAWARDGTRASARPVGVTRIFDAWLEFDGEPGAFSDHAGVMADVEFAAGGSPAHVPQEQAIALARERIELGREIAQSRRTAERGMAAGGLVAAAGATVGARRLGADRRGFVRTLLWTLAGMGVVGAAGTAALSEYFVAQELEGYDYVEADLDALEAQVGSVSS